MSSKLIILISIIIGFMILPVSFSFAQSMIKMLGLASNEFILFKALIGAILRTVF